MKSISNLRIPARRYDTAGQTSIIQTEPEPVITAPTSGTTITVTKLPTTESVIKPAGSQPVVIPSSHKEDSTKVKSVKLKLPSTSKSTS